MTVLHFILSYLADSMRHISLSCVRLYQRRETNKIFISIFVVMVLINWFIACHFKSCCPIRDLCCACTCARTLMCSLHCKYESMWIKCEYKLFNIKIQEWRRIISSARVNTVFTKEFMYKIFRLWTDSLATIQYCRQQKISWHLRSRFSLRHAWYRTFYIDILFSLTHI